MKRIPLNQGDKIKLNNQEYTVGTVIGDGATCIVYSAYYEDNLGLPHRVNIKECYPYNADIVRYGNTLVWKSDTERVQNLSAFSTAYKKLMSTQKGNFVVHAFNIDKYNETLYIVMDANDGVTFDNDNADNLVDILKTLKLLAYVVGEYHKSGYLHLDIKPSNFLVYPRPSDHTILFDMDTITPIEDIKSGQVKVCSYSEDWAAPEQKQGKISKLCPATDIYAIGAVLFEKVMGRQVECGDSCLFAEWDFDGDFFEDVNPKIKRLLSNIFRKTLSANIKRRYQNAYELIKDLEEAIKVASCDVYLKGDDICCSGCFFGRETELTLIKEHFDSKRKAVFLHGFGGIGKTEIARRYAEINSNYYDTVLFIKYNGNDTLQELLNDIDIVNFDTNDSKEKWRKLRSLIDEHTLVIVDNFDIEVGADNGLKSLFETKAHILIATRTDFTSVYNGDKYGYIEVKELASNELEQVFTTNAKITVLDDSDRTTLKKIFKLIENHTYATELLAKQMWYSGWTIEELYQKVKSGFASLENVERITANKDENTVKEKSLNILRAVYNLTDLTEGQKQVLRDFYLLDFVKITKDVYEELLQYDLTRYSAAIKNNCELGQPVIPLDDINTLIEIGLLKSEHKYYSLHKLIRELIKIELRPDETNCNSVYCYVLYVIDWFSEENQYSEALNAESEYKAMFLLRFFEALDLTNIIDAKLILRWLCYIFDKPFAVNDLSYIDRKLLALYTRLEYLDICIEADDRFDLYFSLFKVWLYRCNHYFLVEGEYLHQMLSFCEDKSIKFFNLAIDESYNDEQVQQIISYIVQLINESVSTRMFIREAYGDVFCDDDSTILHSRIPQEIIQTAFYIKSDAFDISAWDKQYYKLPLTEQDIEEIKSNSSLFFDEPNENINEWSINCDIIENDLKTAIDKPTFLNTLLNNEKYSISQKAYLLGDLLEKVFYPMISSIEIDSEDSLFNINESNLSFVGAIFYKLKELVEKNKVSIDKVYGAEWLLNEPTFNAIVSAYYGMTDFFYWLNYMNENEEFFEDNKNSNRFIDDEITVDFSEFKDYSFQGHIDYVANACIKMCKCRYVLPILAKELMKSLQNVEPDNHDEFKKYYPMIHKTMVCAERALDELDNIYESDPVLNRLVEVFIETKRTLGQNTDADGVELLRDFYGSIYNQIKALSDSITNKTFDLKPDTEE